MNATPSKASAWDPAGEEGTLRAWSVMGPVIRPSYLHPDGTSVLTIILRPLHSRGWFLLVWWRNWPCHRRGPSCSEALHGWHGEPGCLTLQINF